MTYISVKSSIKNNPAARLMPDKGLEGLCPEREDRVGPACALEVSALFVCRAGIKGHKEWGEFITFPSYPCLRFRPPDVFLQLQHPPVPGIHFLLFLRFFKNTWGRGT